MSPPSHTALPDTLCPPPRTEISRPSARANLTQATTSAALAQRAIRAGRLSIMALKIRRVAL
jgi:hypothetical protein